MNGTSVINFHHFFPTDFNCCYIKYRRDAGYEDLESGERFYASVGQHLGKPPAEYDDLESLHYALLSIADVQLPWLNLTTRPEIGEKKLRTKQVEVIVKQLVRSTERTFSLFHHLVTGTVLPNKISRTRRIMF